MKCRLHRAFLNILTMNLALDTAGYLKGQRTHFPLTASDCLLLLQSLYSHFKAKALTVIYVHINAINEHWVFRDLAKGCLEVDSRS